MSPLEKLRTVTELNLAVQQLSLAGIRLRHLAYEVYPEAARMCDR